jgi:hypothetical protein
METDQFVPFFYRFSTVEIGAREADCRNTRSAPDFAPCTAKARRQVDWISP